MAKSFQYDLPDHKTQSAELQGITQISIIVSLHVLDSCTETFVKKFF